jgi:hypothetical protein
MSARRRSRINAVPQNRPRRRDLGVHGEATTKHGTLLGYTKYKDYLSASKSVLGERTKFVGTTVVRRYTVNRGVESSLLGLKSRGALVVTYAAEFSFGYDLAPGSYDVVDTPAGIEIRVASPTVGRRPRRARPAPPGARERVVHRREGGRAEALRGLERRRPRGGRKDAVRREIVALCERTLTAFLHDFLAKQPGVERVPAITVSYRNERRPAEQKAASLGRPERRSSRTTATVGGGLWPKHRLVGYAIRKGAGYE